MRHMDKFPLMGAFIFVFDIRVMLILGLTLPSDGNHGMFAPKSLAFLATAGTFTLYLIAHRHYLREQAKAGLLILFSFAFLIFWYAVGIDQDPLRPSGQYDQFKVFLITLFVPFVSYYMVKQKLITVQSILKTIIYANCVYCTAKVMLMGMHVLHIINLWSILGRFGLRFMSMEIMGNLGRIQTSVDIVTPYLIFFVLQDEAFGLRFSRKFKLFYFIFSIISNFLSFSRLRMFGYFASLFFYWLTLRLPSVVRMLVASLIVMGIGVVIVTPERVFRVIEKRLLSSDNYYSDRTRHDQIQALLESCEETPLFGKGLGGYTSSCIRDHLLPHAYEVQWVAFLMQFGIFGVFLLLIPIAIIALKLIEAPLTRVKLTSFLLFGLWLLSGFTNPFMISLTSGIVYTIFLLAGEHLSGKSEPAPPKPENP